MATSWPSDRDNVLNTQAILFSAVLSAGPVPYGSTAPEATALATLVENYSEALAVAQAPDTRSKLTVGLKDISRANLLPVLRSVAQRIQANLAVSDAQRLEIGLPVRSTTRTPTPPPTTRPLLSVAQIEVGSILYRVADSATPTRRARPAGAAGAEVYSYVAAAGVQPPADLTTWKPEGIITRGSFLLSFGTADAGKIAYVVARWFNARGEFGPLSTAVQTPIAATPPNPMSAAQGDGESNGLSLAA